MRSSSRRANRRNVTRCDSPPGVGVGGRSRSGRRRRNGRRRRTGRRDVELQQQRPHVVGLLRRPSERSDRRRGAVLDRIGGQDRDRVAARQLRGDARPGDLHLDLRVVHRRADRDQDSGRHAGLRRAFAVLVVRGLEDAHPPSCRRRRRGIGERGVRRIGQHVDRHRRVAQARHDRVHSRPLLAQLLPVGARSLAGGGEADPEPAGARLPGNLDPCTAGSIRRQRCLYDRVAARGREHDRGLVDVLLAQRRVQIPPAQTEARGVGDPVVRRPQVELEPARRLVLDPDDRIADRRFPPAVAHLPAQQTKDEVETAPAGLFALVQKHAQQRGVLVDVQVGVGDRPQHRVELVVAQTAGERAREHLRRRRREREASDHLGETAWVAQPRADPGRGEGHDDQLTGVQQTGLAERLVEPEVGDEGLGSRAFFFAFLVLFRFELGSLGRGLQARLCPGAQPQRGPRTHQTPLEPHRGGRRHREHGP